MKKLGLKLVLFFDAVLILLTVSIIIISSLQTQNFGDMQFKAQVLSMSGLSLELINNKYPGDWNIKDNKLYKGEFLMNENYEFVDLVNRLTGGNATIFQGDVRVSTNVIVDGNRAIGTTASEEVKQKVLITGENYNGIAKIGAQSFQAHYVPLKSADGKIIGMLFTGINRSVLEKSTSENIFVISVFSIILMLISMLVFVIYNRLLISKPIKELTEVLNVIADGDYTVKVPEKYKNRKDEISQISKAASMMKYRIKDSLTEINNIANGLSKEAEELSALSEETTATSEELTGQVENVNNNAQIVAASIEELSATVEQISLATLNVSHSTLELSTSVRNVEESTANGEKSVEEISIKIKHASEETNLTAAKVKELSHKAENIGKIVEAIKSITEQTNLLALNAAIEAARAGEAGKGFAVVADEIRKLADDSKKATLDITEILGDIKSKTAEADVETQKTVGIVDSIYQDAVIISNEFKEIASQVSTISERIGELTASAEETSSSSEEMSKTMNQSNKEIQDITEQIQEIFSSISLQSQAASKVSDSSQSLAENSDVLKTNLEKFKI